MNHLISETSINREKGFTIIEVLVAMVIFSIGVMGVAQMQMQALNSNKRAFQQTEAAMWATSEAEDILSRTYTEVLASVLEGSKDVGPNSKYNVAWKIEEPTTRTITIKITVSWNGSTGVQNFVFDSVKYYHL